MNFKKIFEELNLPKQAKRLGISIWQHPQFLFLVMGIVIILAIILGYIFGNRLIDDPLIVVGGLLILTMVLLVIDYIITQSFQRLLEVSKLKTEFIEITSHQLRTPLTNIGWIIDLLASKKNEEIELKQADYFDLLKENSQRMLRLISNLITVSKIEEGDFIRNHKEVAVDEILKEKIQRTRALALSKNLRFQTKIEENLPKIEADPNQIEIIFENLIDNALKYSKAESTIEISLYRKDKNLYFEIKDRGYGIPKEDRKYIFQKFFRSSNINKNKTDGTGLGLFIVKSIINKMKGKIDFKSEEGKGTTFWFTLPIK